MIVISCIARDLDMPAVNFVFFSILQGVCVCACDQKHVVGRRHAYEKN